MEEMLQYFPFFVPPNISKLLYKKPYFCSWRGETSSIKSSGGEECDQKIRIYIYILVYLSHIDFQQKMGLAQVEKLIRKVQI